MLSASHVAFISRPRPIDGKPVRLQRPEKFLLLGTMELLYAMHRCGEGDERKRDEDGEGGGRGAATAALARCFSGIAARRGCPFRKMSPCMSQRTPQSQEPVRSGHHGQVTWLCE
ncbi:hypothetical protein SAMN05216299_11731 [Nitrosospira sp. Nsp14]|nr:hypothetical protein SAMN05216299_11731 [Nitrosospira sp. Nsp14]